MFDSKAIWRNLRNVGIISSNQVTLSFPVDNCNRQLTSLINAPVVNGSQSTYGSTVNGTVSFSNVMTYPGLLILSTLTADLCLMF